MGDLNSGREDPEIRRLASMPGVLEPLALVSPADTSDRVDWIFVRGLKVRGAGIRELRASDHPCVWAELEPAW